MELIIILCVVIIIIVILGIVYDINLKELKKFGEDEEKKLNKLTDKYPSNIEICKYVLNKLKNNKVKIQEDESMDSCLYIAVTNKIIIGNIKKSYTRIQTVAHECIHSIQNRKILLFNFYFSNFYLVYFVLIAILALINKLNNQMMHIIIMLLLSYTYYFTRSYLEMDAMIKAKFLAKEYMEEMNLSNKEEIDIILNSYTTLNYKGIKIVNYNLMFSTLIKVIILIFLILL